MCVDQPASSWLLQMPRRRIGTKASATAILTPWCLISYYAVRIALQLSNKLCSGEVGNPSASLLSACLSFHGNNTQCVLRNSLLCYFQRRRDIPRATFPSGLLIVQYHKSHNAPFPIFHNSPFSTEICTILFWMVYCGVWDRCIEGFVNLVHYLRRGNYSEATLGSWRLKSPATRL